MPTGDLVESLSIEAQTDPEWFFREVLRERRIYPKQLELLSIIAKYPRVSCLGANASGKDFIAARAVLWYLATHYPAKVLVFGPSHRQVSEIIFREMRLAYDNAIMPLGGEMFRKSPKWEINDEHFVLGFSTDVAFNLTGFHSPNLFVVITEAHAMEQDHINKIKTLGAKKTLMTGNPFAEYGEFWESFHNKRHLWKTIEISAFDTPNVIEGREVIPGLITREQIEMAKQDWGEDNPLYIASVLGQFPDNLTDSIVSLSLAVAATKSDAKPEGAKIAACDVARHGLARTVLCERQGLYSTFPWKHQGKDTTVTIGRLKLYLDENPDVRTLFVDDVGIGGSVTDALLEKDEYRSRVIPFIGGGKAQNATRYANATTEAWFLMGAAYKAGLRTPDDPNLIAQVVSRKFKIRSDKILQLVSKSDPQSSTEPSCDESDALSMTFAARPPEPKMYVIDASGRDVKEPSEAELKRMQAEADQKHLDWLRGEDVE